jgi:hypothetical protein
MPKRGGAAAVAAVLVAGALDVGVIAWTGDSITAACRRHPLITSCVLGSFVLHLIDRPRRLRWADPYRAIGTAARCLRRTSCPAPEGSH